MIHLHPYGIFLDLDPATKRHPIPEDVKLAKAVLVSGKIALLDESGSALYEFKILKQIGRGGYSDVFTTDLRIGGMETVVKRIRVSEYAPDAVTTEALTQILVVRATEDYSDGRKGPFAPRFFCIGADADFYYLLSERIGATLKDLVEAIVKPSLLMYLFVEVAETLKILWETVRFNHRDMKFDNVMMDDAGRIRIVDFGLSCLKFGSLQIEPAYSHLRKIFDHCDLRSRDMKTFFNYFLHHTKFKTLDCPLKRIVKALMFSGHEEPSNWEGSYPVFNAEPNLPNMFPETVVNVLRSLKFVDAENLCSEAEPSWIRHVGELNKGLIKTLTKEELREIPKAQLLEYLENYPSARLFSKVEKTTNDEDIRTFCQKGLNNPNLEMNTETRKGGRRHRRKTRKL
jgi:hypothetical protein